MNLVQASDILYENNNQYNLDEPRLSSVHDINQDTPQFNHFSVNKYAYQDEISQSNASRLKMTVTPDFNTNNDNNSKRPGKP